MAVLWAIVAKDLPEQHRMVNEAEKRFIMENRDIVATEKSSPPWNDFLNVLASMQLQFNTLLYNLSLHYS